MLALASKITVVRESGQKKQKEVAQLSDYRANYTIYSDCIYKNYGKKHDTQCAFFAEKKSLYLGGGGCEGVIILGHFVSLSNRGI